MGKLLTTQEGNLDQLQPPSSNDLGAPTTAAVSSPPALHSHTTTSFSDHPTLEDTGHHLHLETSQHNKSSDSSPAVPFPPQVQSPIGSTDSGKPLPPVDDDIDSIPAVAFPPPSRVHQIHAPPPNNQQHDGSAGVHAVPVGQMSASGSTRLQSQLDDNIDSIPAVAFPPPSRVQVIDVPPAPNNQPLAVCVQPDQSNNVQNVGGGDVYGVPVGQSPAMGSIRQRSQIRRAQIIIVPPVGNPWTSGLFDCFQHPTNAIITTLAPCVTFGQIAELVDNGSTGCVSGAMLYVFLFLVMCHWNIGVRYRGRLRNAFQLSETPVTDQIAHAMFPLCALCQEFRELKNQGYDPFLGYQGVIAKFQQEQKQQSENNPPTSQFMTR